MTIGSCLVSCLLCWNRFNGFIVESISECIKAGLRSDHDVERQNNQRNQKDGVEEDVESRYEDLLIFFLDALLFLQELFVLFGQIDISEVDDVCKTQTQAGDHQPYWHLWQGWT